MTNEAMIAIGVVLAIGMITGLLASKRLKASYRNELLDTGLRAIDLFLPIPAGGDILLTGDTESGTVVLANELAFRFQQSGRHHVVYYVDDALPDADTRYAELKELLPNLSEMRLILMISETELQEQLATAGRRDVVVFVATESERFMQTFRDIVRQIRETVPVTSTLTLLYVSEHTSTSPFDTTIFSSRLIAKEGIYPAIDLRVSTSSAWDRLSITSRRRDTANAAADAVRSVTKSLYAGSVQDPDWVFYRDTMQRPALQALCFLSQPYFTAEVYTGKKAAWISVDQAVRSYADILSGSRRATPANRFLYQNELPPSE
ncbi:MAG: hypothetical protein R3C59_07055 [Planctomycetaceae bacterium]